MTSARRASFAATLAVTALLAAGCGSSDSGDSADGESLVVYSGRSEELVGPIVDQFEEATGIEVDVRYGDTTGMAAQLIEEGDQSPADLFWAQDAGALGAVAEEGMFAPIEDALLDRVPEQYRAADGTWVAITGRARVIAYNADNVPAADVPSTVAELTQPQWRSRVAIAPSNASFQSFVTAMRLVEGDEAAQQWLDDMVANDVQTYEKNTLILDAVDAGEVDLGLINHYYWFEKAAEVGEDAMTAQIAFTEPGDPGTLVNIAGVGVLAGAADNPDAAAFVDYMLGEPAQEAFVESTAEYPMIDGVAQPEGLPALAEIQGPDISLAELSDLPTTVQMIQDAGLL